MAFERRSTAKPKRPDVSGIDAAAHAVAQSHQVHNGAFKWPGTAHIEAAVDAYLAKMGLRVVPERRIRKDRRITLERRRQS